MSSLINLSELLAEAPEPKGSCGLLSQGIAPEGEGREVLEIVRELSSGAAFVHFAGKGAWSMHELLLALMGHIGNAHVLLSSYAMSETAARCFAMLRDSRQLLSLSCIIDNRVEVRTAGSLQLLRSISDSMTLCACHAKVTLLYNRDMQLTIVSSANYTENKRYEAGFVSSQGSVFAFHKKWMQEAIAEHGQYNP